jgi:hypothetical protein
LLLLQLGACSSGIDDRIYGTWVDPVGQSEPVIFREDGTVSWFGEEGTFEDYHSHSTQDLGICEPGYSALCFESDYTARGVRVLTPSRAFHIRYTHNCFFNDDCDKLFRDDEENYWRLDPRTGEGSVLLFRKSALEYPLMPEPFEKLGEGWGFPENDGFPWDGPGLYSYEYRIVSSNPIRAEQDGDYYVYNEANATWEKEQTPQEKSKSKLLLDRVDRDGPECVREASLDQGSTWKTLPVLSNEKCWGDGLTTVTETSIVRMFLPRDGNEYQLWTINASAESPLWVLRNSFDASNYNTVGQGKSLYVHPTNGTIAWTFESGRELTSEISHDFGATWKTFDLFDNEDPGRQCDIGRFMGLRALENHHNGFYCLREDDSKLRWYDFTSQKWTTHDVGFESRGRTWLFFSPTDGLYIRRGAELIKWQPDGTETLITTLSGSLGEYGNIYIFDDEVIVNKFGFWRIWR